MVHVHTEVIQLCRVYMYTQRSFHCVVCTCTYRVSQLSRVYMYSVIPLCQVYMDIQVSVNCTHTECTNYTLTNARGKLSSVVTNTVSALGRQRLEAYEFEATPGLEIARSMPTGLFSEIPCQTHTHLHTPKKDNNVRFCLKTHTFTQSKKR